MIITVSLLGGLEQAANSEDKNSKKSAGTLDYWKLLSRCGFLHAQNTVVTELKVRGSSDS